ncbi:hypothetical protein SAMN04487913_109102 [Arthrobacter sp. ok362]|nr:hypothetical protein SAMN04487913_109102 [Arthrobacter sp. ok362]
MTPEELARRSAEVAESAAHAAWWAAAGSILTALLTLGLLVGETGNEVGDSGDSQCQDG